MDAPKSAPASVYAPDESTERAPDWRRPMRLGPARSVDTDAMAALGPRRRSAIVRAFHQFHDALDRGAAAFVTRIGRTFDMALQAVFGTIRGVGLVGASILAFAPYLVAGGAAGVYAGVLSGADMRTTTEAGAQTAPISAPVPRPAALAGVVGAAGAVAAAGAIGPLGVREPYRAPEHSLATLSRIPFRAGRAIDEGYRTTFADCDQTDRFPGAPVRAGGCSREPNAFNAFLRLPAAEIGAGAVFLEATPSLDLSGSWLACGAGGSRPVDAKTCATFYDYADVSGRAYLSLADNWDQLFVSSDRIPFVTIPAIAPGGEAAALERGRAFADRAGVEVGDVGVVIYRNRVVPVLVANAGPTHRALGGSLALFDAMGVSRCRTRLESDPALCAEAKRYGLGTGVVTILFPDSRLDGLTAETALPAIRERAMERMTMLMAGAEALAAAGRDDGSVIAPSPRPSPRMAAFLRRLPALTPDASSEAPPAGPTTPAPVAPSAETDAPQAPGGEVEIAAPTVDPTPPAPFPLTDAPLLAPHPTPRPAGATAIVISAASRETQAPLAAPRPTPRLGRQ